MSKILKRNYDLNIHFEASKEDKQLFILLSRFESVSLRQLDESINMIRFKLESAGHVITMAEVLKADSTEEIPNCCFISLKDIPEGITKTEGQING